MILKHDLSPVRIAGYVWQPVSYSIGVAVFAAVLAEATNWASLALPFAPVGVLGSAMAIFVTFRNNASFARWWEARTAWQAVHNASRNFARHLVAFTDDAVSSGRVTREQADAFAVELVHRQIAYAYLLGHELRRTDPWNDVAGLVDATELAVTYVVRDPDYDRHRPLLDDTPGARLAGSPTDVSNADVVLIAVPWAATETVARSLQPGPATIVIDATNQLLPGFSGLDPAVTPSAGEMVARWTGSSRVVKAFSTTGSANMADTTYPGGTPAMFLAGDDAAAKTVVAGLASELGFDPVDVGPLAESRSLEELALLWIRLAYVQGFGPKFAFAVLRRP